MEGELDINLYNEIEISVRSIVKEEDISVVCFLPGSTKAKTILRFSELSSELSSSLDCDVFLDVITLSSDSMSNQVFYQCKQERVMGRNILIIGGVYTNDKLHSSIKSLVLEQGAKKVEMFFIAKMVADGDRRWQNMF